MKDKHVDSYISLCLATAKLSPCTRRKYGAVAVDPTHNVIISSGYNGTPRGSKDELCGGIFCRRDGVKFTDDLRVHDRGHAGVDVNLHLGGRVQTVLHKDHDFSGPPRNPALDDRRLIEAAVAKLSAIPSTGAEVGVTSRPLLGHRQRRRLRLRALLERWHRESRESEHGDDGRDVVSGTRYEVGCHHAEANVVANAARLGRPLSGSWVFCSGMPCVGCARLLHHAGVARVVTIRGGYAGESGAPYLRANGVEVSEVDPPENPIAAMKAGLSELMRELEAVGRGADCARKDNAILSLVDDMQAIIALVDDDGSVVDPGGR